MKFLASLIGFFAIIYVLIFTHYISFDKEQKIAQIQALSAKINGASASFSFASDEYRKFVYDK